MGNRREKTDRRQTTDRRGGDRRRGANVRYPVFEISRSMLHLALVIENEGDRADKLITRSVRWRNKSHSLHTEQGAQELKRAVMSLVQEERLAGARARIVLNGELCVTRVISGSSEHVRREVSDQEDRCQLYLSLGPGKKVQATCVQQLDARHQHALVSVANQRTLNTLVEIAVAAGIHLDSIEPSLVALTRAQNRLKESIDEPCIVVQLDERGAELGLCHGGKLLLDYRPAGRAAAKNLAEIIGEHMTRLERYLSNQHGYSGTRLRRLYLTGEPGPVEQAKLQFQGAEQMVVDVLSPERIVYSWQHVGQQPGTELTAALGSAFSLSEESGIQPSPNLMEHILAGTKQPLKPFLTRCSIPIAAILLIAATLLLLTCRQSYLLYEQRAKLESLAPMQVVSRQLRLELAGAQEKAKLINEIDRQIPNISWANVIRRIGHNMPDEVWLDRLSVADSCQGTINGASSKDGSIYDFVGYLEKLPELRRVALEGTGLSNSPAGPSTSFEVKFALRCDGTASTEVKLDD